MTGITYPSGRQVSYTLDALGRIQSVATTKDSATQTVVSSVAYRPFGPSTGFTFGNGQTYNRGFDQDGRIASYTLATQSIAVGYDAASRITSLTDTGIPANTNTYGYDTLDRLTGFTGPSTNQAYTFDATGNRLTKTVGAATDTYTYSGTSNQLSTIAGSTNRTYAYDPNGSTTGDTANTYAYDARGRMVQATGVGGTSTYQVNSVGQRIRKTNTQGDTIYHYDSQGRLISETSASGTPQREYIYLGDTPVAVIQ
jgi:YD repeat-containing protein